MAVTITTAAARRTSIVAAPTGSPVRGAPARPLSDPAPKRRQLRKPQAITPQNNVPFTMSNRPYGVVHRLATDPTYVQLTTRPAATSVAAPEKATGEKWQSNKSPTSDGGTRGGTTTT